MTQAFIEGFRVCYNCKERKPLDSFNRDKWGTQGRGYLCKVCSRERSKRNYYLRREVFPVKIHMNKSEKKDKLEVVKTLEYYIRKRDEKRKII